MTEPRPYTPRAVLRDVTLRDGLQLTAKMLPTDRKVEIVRQLLALGVSDVEIGSMARPDLVPPLADTIEVISALTPEELQRCWIWVATPRHIEKAAAVGARNFQYCLSASDSHNQANIGRSTEASVAAMPDAIRITHEVGGSIQLCIATALTCPFEGLVDPERVVGIANDARTVGAQDIVLCDTLGQAIPTQVTDLIGAVRDERPSAASSFTATTPGDSAWPTPSPRSTPEPAWSTVRSAAWVAARSRRAPAATPPARTCCSRPDRTGSPPTRSASLVDVTEKLLAEIGEPNRSKTAQGAHSKAKAFDWVIGDRA